MNVSYSESITNTIKDLRENVYGNDNFKNEFTERLSKKIGAENTSFIPEHLGGWSVNINLNNNTKESSSYVHDITDVLMDTIHAVHYKAPNEKLACNLSNIIRTSQTNLIVKL